MTVQKVRIDWIRVEGRHRRDLGDLSTLAKSIEENGLINPVTVDPDGRLLAGGRRVTAVRMLGWTHIMANIVDTFEDATKVLLIERDENTERKPMTPSELVSLGRALEEMERPTQIERRRQAGRIAAAKRLGREIEGAISSSTEENIRPSMKTDEEVAAVLGTSATQYYKAKAVVHASTDSGRSEEERVLAAEAVANMDAGVETISGAYERIKANRPAPRPRTRSVIEGLAAQRRAITSAEAALSGLAIAMSQINELHPEITSEEAARWVDSLSESRRVITVLINLLKERTQ